MASSTPTGSVTTLEDVLEVVGAADANGLALWIDGGWGVDALLREETRPHGDLDLAILAREAARFEETLASLGYERCHEPGATPWNFLLAHSRGAVVDLHLITRDEAGNGILGPAENASAYPAESLRGEGTIGGTPVRCISAASAVAFHDAYAGDADDRADVRALCARFGVPIPPQYR